MKTGARRGGLPSRRLQVERLECRAMPASLVEVVELSINTTSSTYDVVATPSGLLIGDGRRLLRLDDNGRLLGSVQLTPAGGHQHTSIWNLSEDGRLAVGYSFTDLLDTSAEARPIVTLWELAKPQSPIALDFLDYRRVRWGTAIELSDVGHVVVATSDKKIYLASRSGIQELELPPGAATRSLSGGLPAFVADLSADGRLLVGRTLAPLDPGLDPNVVRWRDYFRATVWRDGTVSLLPVPDGTLTSSATTVSGDGRVIGGSVASLETGTVAAVWIDGRLQTLRLATGEPMRGEVRFVVSGIDGDPSKWLALGQSYGGGFPDSTFVAGPDGIAHPLTDWLRANYGFEGSLHAIALADVVLADGRLRLFTRDSGFDPRFLYGPTLVGPEIGAPSVAVRTGNLMITIDLQGNHASVSPHDVNADGQLTPLDALLVINALTKHGPGPIAGREGLFTGGARIDVNRDGVLSPLDALLVINELSRQTQGGDLSAGDTSAGMYLGEGESAASPPQASEPARVLPRQTALPIERWEELRGATLLSSGRMRIAGNAWLHGYIWEFHSSGELVREQAMPLLPQRTHSEISAISPSGRWLVGMQYDLDYSDGQTIPAANVLWDADNPSVVVEIDLSAFPAIHAQVAGVADDGSVVLRGGAAGPSAYRWDAAGGLKRLTSFHEHSGASDPQGTEATVAAISADGSVAVGVSGYHHQGLPTVWTADGPWALPALGGSGEAALVSPDGRIVGGALHSGANRRPVVWADGQLVPLTMADGEPAAGQITAVVNGPGGDPSRWIAFGVMERQGWIALSDGVVRPLDEWLQQHYDLYVGSETAVLDAFVRDNVLHLAVHEWRIAGMTHGIPPSIFYEKANPRWIVAPLSPSGGPLEDHPFDVNQDGKVTPLDALLVINALNKPDETGGTADPLGRRDINGDGQLTPLDALLLINHLNQRTRSASPLILLQSTIAPGRAEGEPSIDSETWARAIDAIWEGSK